MRTSQAAPATRGAGAPLEQQAHAGSGVRVIRALLRALFGTCFRVRVIGRRAVPPTPVIICANHLGWADLFLVLLYFPVQPRIYVLAEREVEAISPARTWFFHRLQILVPLDRGKPREALAVMTAILERGGSLLIFPEGQVGHVEGTLAPLQHGAAHLSQLTGVPLLPVGLTGPSVLWLGRRLVLRIGRPLAPTAFSGDLRARIRAQTAALDTALRALLPGDTQRPRFRPLRRRLTELF